MIELQNKVLNKTIKIQRILGHYKGKEKGPTLIFLAGIHGNEPSGVFALQSVIEELYKGSISFRGNLYAISGNLAALQKGIRFSQIDLNRVWSRDTVHKINGFTHSPENEDIREQVDIYKTINTILDAEEGPFYFFDLHTTSGVSCPFLTVNDSLLNRKFTKQYPVPIVLGIEEYLDGPLLSYINELGYVAFGFEGGQHDAPVAYENHKSFIYLSLMFTGALSESNPTGLKHYQRLVDNCKIPRKFFEIVFHYKIEKGENFKMHPNFVNFQRIRKHEALALSENAPVEAPIRGKIFMPLYQGKGDDGFFIIRKIPMIFLALSKVLRNIYLDRFLVLLPGINWGSKKREELVVNLRIARFFTKQFFHLLGYRARLKDSTHLMMKNREAASRDEDYKKEKWL